MFPLRARAALAASALLLPVVPAAAAGVTGHLVLSVSPAFRTTDLPAGTTVTDAMPAIGAVVVTAPLSSVGALTRVPGVRGISPDRTMHTTGATYEGGRGVLAPTAVGGAAGTYRAGKGVIVAVLDTGVADTPALNRNGHLYRGPDFSGESSTVRDGFGHGTFMANLVAGGPVDDITVGVAPAAYVVDVKVAGSDGSTQLSRVLRGLNWVAETGADKGVRVLSLSLSADRPTDGYGSDPLTDAADAVQSKGVTVVVAAGNNPAIVSDPGQDPALMTIGAADTTGSITTVAPFSGRGTVAYETRPDVVAPGVRMLSFIPDASAIAQAHPEAASGRLFRGSGTSQATAVAAGEVAVFLSGRTDVSPQDVRASFAAAATSLHADGDGAGFTVIPTTVVRGTGAVAGTPTSGGSDPTTSSTSWSSTSWSSTSWSSTSWSSTSWSSTSWSSTSWSSTSWSAGAWG